MFICYSKQIKKKVFFFRCFKFILFCLFLLFFFNVGFNFTHQKGLWFRMGDDFRVDLNSNPPLLSIYVVHVNQPRKWLHTHTCLHAYPTWTQSLCLCLHGKFKGLGMWLKIWILFLSVSRKSLRISKTPNIDPQVNAFLLRM